MINKYNHDATIATINGRDREDLCPFGSKHMIGPNRNAPIFFLSNTNSEVKRLKFAKF